MQKWRIAQTYVAHDLSVQTKTYLLYLLVMRSRERSSLFPPAMPGRSFMRCFNPSCLHNVCWVANCSYRVADDYAGTTAGMVFNCAVPGCKAKFTPERTVERFYNHLNNPIHYSFYYRNKQHRCPFGCEKGFYNEFALDRHIRDARYEKAEDLEAEIRKYKHCAATLPDMLGAPDHLEQVHSHLLASTTYTCTPCGVGFPLEALLWAHLALKSARSDAHTVVTKELGL